MSVVSSVANYSQSKTFVAGHRGMVGSAIVRTLLSLGVPQENILDLPMQGHINVGFGSDITIDELAHAVSRAVGYPGSISFDATKPDGSPRKWMDSTRLNSLGWCPKTELAQGLALAYEDFSKNKAANGA